MNMEKWLAKNGWVALFVLLLLFSYAALVAPRERAIEELSFRLHEMKKQERCLKETKEELSLRLQSQEDPAWMELVLMKELGVVPEGWVKVHFSK